MGSKARIQADISPIINKYIKDNDITNFYDIFCGGANLADKIICDNIYCSDLSPTLIALHKQAQTDFSVIPEEDSREWWDAAYSDYKIILKNLSNNKNLKDYQELVEMPLWKIGAIEWYASYNARGFIGGYGKPCPTVHQYIMSRKNHFKQSQNPIYQKINFSCADYQNLEIPENVLIFCDSPYKGVKPYQINPHFNHAKYYEWLREKSKTNPIFISEQEMPDDFNVIWQKETKRTMDLKGRPTKIEKLYFIDRRENNG